MAKNSLLGYAAAGAVGVLIGIVVAPEKGSKNFKSVKRFINDWATKMLDEIQAGKDNLEDYADEARDKAFELKGKAQAKAEDFADDVRHTYADAKSDVNKSFS
ncbi:MULTISPECIES: YtxH domain-containing protein [unclassified Siphonobacter]|nr:MULTISPECIES: YtxH domain-containing protein [unclassified Siphonobacter]MDQ1087262.1 gas vesicle protein [Siphonobacter sp. SORGH_AS_1065]MDR6193426.1 gas vesicle protein [Siphonobacter sp. SORGH_AS_0500]